jgi:hypothetical protein
MMQKSYQRRQNTTLNHLNNIYLKLKIYIDKHLEIIYNIIMMVSQVFYMAQYEGGDNIRCKFNAIDGVEIKKLFKENVMENLNGNETKTVNASKEFANYDVNELSFMAKGIKRFYTFDNENVKKLNPASIRLLLIGARNVVVDSIASLTIKNGFTDEHRKAKMDTTMSSLNEGKMVSREGKLPSIPISQFAGVSDIMELRLLVKMKVPLNAIQLALLENALVNDEMELGENS